MASRGRRCVLATCWSRVGLSSGQPGKSGCSQGLHFGCRLVEFSTDLRAFRPRQPCRGWPKACLLGRKAAIEVGGVRGRSLDSHAFLAAPISGRFGQVLASACPSVCPSVCPSAWPMLGQCLGRAWARALPELGQSLGQSLGQCLGQCLGQSFEGLVKEESRWARLTTTAKSM
jgi:hypothetical protein